jgi:hypothetical protein
MGGVKGAVDLRRPAGRSATPASLPVKRPRTIGHAGIPAREKAEDNRHPGLLAEPVLAQKGQAVPEWERLAWWPTQFVRMKT